MKYAKLSRQGRRFVLCTGLCGLLWYSAELHAQDAAPESVLLEAPAPEILAEDGNLAATAEASSDLHKFDWAQSKDVCYPCGPPGDCWIRAEYLAWWMQGAEAPPLITQSPADTPINNAGVIGTPGTEVLFGDGPVNAEMRSGFRLRAGKWLDCCHTNGVELGFFMLGSNLDSGQANCFSGTGVVSRPFVDAGTGQNQAELVCYPGVLCGMTTVDARANNLLGAEALWRHNICCDDLCCYDACDTTQTCIRRDLLIGFRYLHYDDQLVAREALLPVSEFVVPGTRIDLEDNFQAWNDFFGLKLGLHCQRNRGPWSFELRPELSVGLLHSRVSINGQTAVSIPGVGNSVDQGGLLAQSSNIGDYTSDQFVLIPELDLQLGYQLRPHVRLLCGYSFLYVPQLMRAAEQIDLAVNTQLIPPVQPPVTGPQRPAYQGSKSDAWVQGLTLGVECRF